jgi:hypothetical protein
MIARRQRRERREALSTPPTELAAMRQTSRGAE